MADPLSVAASVAGLVSLAGTIAKLAKTMSDRYTEKAAASIQDHVDKLDRSLDRIDASLRSQSFDGPEEEVLKHAVEACTRTLRDIERQLRKLEVKGPLLKSMRGKLSRPEVLRDIERLQSSLKDQKITLLVAMQNCSGESQHTMLQMVFRSIEELRISFDQERNANKQIRRGLSSAETDHNVSKPESPSIVHTYPSFGDWLSTWTDPDQDQPSQSTATRDSSSQSGLVSPGSSFTPNKDLDVELIIEGIGQKGTTKITATRDTPLYDIIHQLEKEPLESRSHLSDDAQGHDQICGFKIRDNDARVPPFIPHNTLLVIVTDGPSSYDAKIGLRINRMERLIDFYNEYLHAMLNPTASKLPVVERNKSHVIVRNPLNSQHCANITFQRTLRLPENTLHLSRYSPGTLSGASEFLGPFPLFNVEDYKERLPEEMNAKGGSFFPMFQREAMAISFQLEGRRETMSVQDMDHFAVKVFAGSVNCISGKTAHELVTNEQDYVICPQQRRLDGYKYTDDKVKQFVPMPLGWGYSAEKQITGKEDVGGIQLQIASRLWDHVTFRRHETCSEEFLLKSTDTSSILGFENGATIFMSDCGQHVEPPGELWLSLRHCDEWQAHQKSYPMFYPMNDNEKYRATTVSDLLQMNGNRDETSSIRLLPVRSLVVHFTFSMKWQSAFGDQVHQSCIFEQSITCSPFFNLGFIVSQCLHDLGIKCNLSSCKEIACSGDSDNTTWSFALRSESRFQNVDATRNYPLWRVLSDLSFTEDEPRITCEMRRCYFRLSHVNAEYNMTSTHWDMGFGAGSGLRQQFHESAAQWDWKNSCIVNFQLLSAAAFTSVTGMSTWTPVSSMEYQKKQLTLQVPLIQGGTYQLETSGMSDLKSIGTTDITSSDSVRTQRRIVTCPQCKINLCNIAVLPCKHIFCSDCIISHTVCYQCESMVVGQVVFSGPMETPIDKFVVDPSSGLLTPEEAQREFESVPQYEKSGVVHESPGIIAEKLSKLTCDDGSLFWFNFITSILKRTEFQVRLHMAKTLLTESTRHGDIYKLECLLSMLPRDSFFEETYGGLELLKELLHNSLECLNTKPGRRIGRPKASTCLEALINWMELESIEPQHIFDEGVPMKWWLRPQPEQSLSRVFGFLKRGGKSLSEYGFGINDLQWYSKSFALRCFLGNKGDSHVLSVNDFLLQDLIHGANLNSRDMQGRTVLWYPTTKLNLLLDNGACMDIRDNNGNTVLHAMVLQEVWDRLEGLLRHRSVRTTINARNRDYLTPYHLVLGAYENWTLEPKWMDIAKMFEEGGADVDLPIPHGTFREDLVCRLNRKDLKGSRFDVARKLLSKSTASAEGSHDWSYHDS